MKELKCSYREKPRIFACIKYCFYHAVHKVCMFADENSKISWESSCIKS